MSEGSNTEISETQQVVSKSSGLTRREFLGGAARIGAVAATLALAGSEAQRIVENKIETSHAVFYPFYELHEEGVDLSSVQLPQNHDIHWVERVDLPFLEGSDIQDSSSSSQIAIQTAQTNLSEAKDNSYAGNLIKGYADRSAEKDNNFEKTLNYLRTHNVSMANGDIMPMKLEAIAPVLAATQVSGAMMDAAIIYFAAKFGIKEVESFKKKVFSQIEEEKQKPKSVSRRSILKAAVGTATTAGLGGVSWLKLLEQSSKANTSSEAKAASRVLTRMIGILSHARPYDNIVFLRNVVWADKLLDLSEKESRSLGRKANISYQVGAVHSGLEDFLILGRDFCQTIIRAYPKSVIEEVIRVNNGVENIVTTRIFKTAPDSPSESNYQSRRVIDEKLQDVLTQKINV